MNVAEVVDASRAVVQVVGAVSVETKIDTFGINLAGDPVWLYKDHHNHNS